MRAIVRPVRDAEARGSDPARVAVGFLGELNACACSTPGNGERSRSPSRATTHAVRGVCCAFSGTLPALADAIESGMAAAGLVFVAQGLSKTLVFESQNRCSKCVDLRNAAG